MANGKVNYTEYLKTEHWQRKRNRALEYANHRCQICNSSRELQVHHNTYDNLGMELDRDMIVLCDDCHSLYSEKFKKLIAAKVENENQDDTMLAPDLYVMVACAINPQLFKKCMFDVEDLTSDAAREIYNTLKDVCTTDECRFDSIMKNIKSDKLRKLLLERVSTEEFAINPEGIIQSWNRRVELIKLNVEKDGILKQLKDIETSATISEIQELQNKITVIMGKMEQIHNAEHGKRR